MTTERLTLFHTNDIHSCFDHWSSIVAYVKANRDSSTLFLDLGDHADRCNLLTEATEGRGNVSLLNEAGVDYATIGNNEGITFSKEQLNKLYEKASFSVLVANVFDEEGEYPVWAKPYVIHQMDNGLKVGMIGLTAPFTRFYKQLGWKIENPFDVLQRLVHDIRSESDVVILMSHLGLFRDEEIAEKIDGIDIIVGAHTHHVLEDGKRICGTVIAQVGKHGSYLGKITLEFDRKEKMIVQEDVRLIQVKDEPSDPKTDHLLTSLHTFAFEQMAEPVATLPKSFPISWQEETEAGAILCEAVTEWCGEKLGMINSGVLLDSLNKGVITKRDIHRVCPHPINPCVVKLTGRALYETIQRSFTKEMETLKLRGFGFRGEVLGRMLFTGIEVDFGVNGLINDVHVLGEVLEPENEYTIATLDMYTFGHLYPAISDASYKAYFMPEFLRDILAWKLGQTWA